MKTRSRIVIWIGGFLALGLLVLTSYSGTNPQPASAPMNESKDYDPAKMKKATFGGGCFWCTEAVFERLDGVVDVVSGYAGGDVENPGYREVSAGTTGHAEVVQITYDPETISYEELLRMHWKSHDPTTLNRQGADVGTQYRSIILFHNDEQKRIAEKSRKAAQEQFREPIVTEIEPLETFYPAEDYHQDYYRKNPQAGYCQFVIAPKLDKLNLD